MEIRNGNNNSQPRAGAALTSPESRIPNPGAPIRVALIAGEASGDLLGAGLIAELRRRYPDAQFAGIGGDGMRAAGMDTWFDASELAVMGLSEVIRHLPRLLRVRRSLRERVLAWKPDVFVGIDAPDFNLGVEKWLKKRGIRTVHYVSPSVWAWRERRAAKIGRSADRVLCLFPMEPPIYAKHRVDARFVGHPLADEMPLDPDSRAMREELGIDPDRPVLALLPGSRVGEIERLAPSFIAAAARVFAEVPELQVVVPIANAPANLAFRRMLGAHPDYEALRPALRILVGNARRLMIASDVVLLASGTATLEAMLAKRPMVVAYKVASLTYALVKGLGLLKVRNYSLPNVLAGERVVPELMQRDCTPEKLAAATLAMLRDGEAMERIAPRFRELHLQLRQNASARAADAVAGLLG